MDDTCMCDDDGDQDSDDDDDDDRIQHISIYTHYL